MRILAYLDEGVDITPLKKKIAPHLDITWVEEGIIDYETVPWETYHYGHGNVTSLGIDRPWIKSIAELAHKKHAEHIDVIMFVVAEKNWEDGRQTVYGWHVETPYSGYQTVQVRANYDLVNIGWHEIMHTLDNIIQIETGVNVTQKLGVTSYDEDIVHSPRGRNNSNWHTLYAETLKVIKPYLDVAIVTRRERFKDSLLETALRLARTYLAQLQAQLIELPPAPPETPLQPIVQRKADQLIALASLHGLDLRITEGYRTIERQNELYAQGRTKPGDIVTNAKGGESFHNYAVAFDVVDRQRGYDTDWKLIGKIGKILGLEHGGDWEFLDNPHFQYTGGYSLKDFQSGQVDYKKLNTETYA